jgi:hypothetical protein
MDLYRVGEPSIGEVWKRRFTFSRGSGGLGTGVYAFRDREAAEENIERSSPDSELFVLEGALTDPIQPRTREATDVLVKLSRYMDLLSEQNSAGQYTYDEALDEIAGDRGGLRAELSSSFSREQGFGDGESLSLLANKVLLNVPELGNEYGFDTQPFLRDFVEATREAESLFEGRTDPTAVQPINVLLYPEYDGVCPVDGAGGNSGRHGCVVFKQKIDECVGRETESFDTVAVTALNRCFG